MKSSYKRLGDFIHKIDVRNKNSQNTKLLGLSMTKEFRPHASNIVGTDLSRYKVVDQWQFACDFMSTIRVRKLPVVLQENDEQIIVSPAYTTFEVIDSNELHPEYLMMWFRRSEFDRYAYFCCDSAVRGGFNWDELCDVQLPVPSIEKQRAIVKEYSTIVNRIKLNEQLNLKLEETALSLYKHWFVDFEFPNEYGQPYKSSGGNMIFNQELGMEIPQGWEVDKLNNILDLIIDHRGKTPLKLGSTWVDSGYPAISAKNIKNGKIVQPHTIRYVDENLFKKWMKNVLEIGDVLMTSEAPMGELFYVAKKTDYLLSQRLYGLRVDKKVCSGSYLFYWLKSDLAINDMDGRATGTTVQGIKQSELKEVLILMPSKNRIESFDVIVHQVFESIELTFLQNKKLLELKDLLLSKMSKIKTLQKEQVL